jgi:hypothetical protein
MSWPVEDAIVAHQRPKLAASSGLAQPLVQP